MNPDSILAATPHLFHNPKISWEGGSSGVFYPPPPHMGEIKGPDSPSSIKKEGRTTGPQLAPDTAGLLRVLVAGGGAIMSRISAGDNPYRQRQGRPNKGGPAPPRRRRRQNVKVNYVEVPSSSYFSALSALSPAPSSTVIAQTAFLSTNNRYVWVKNAA